MRPYLQELTFSGVRNYLIKFLVASFLMMMKHSKVGFLAIPGDRPRLYRKNWVDELGSKRSISEDQAWRTLSSIEDEIALSENDGIVLVPGFISKRKNPELILEAFDIFSKNHKQKKYALVFAGKIDQECKEIFRRPKYQFAHCLDRYLTENEYSALLKSSKLVVLVYDNRASSGVIVDCIEVSTKVILSGADRWKNLFQIYPESIFRGRKSSLSLAEQFAEVLLKPKVKSQSFIWRENRADVLQFCLD
jgi:glycosyltransferase involved in cell wall biosynthesis